MLIAQPASEQFVEFYYQTFDADRSKLKDLYRPESMLTFESSSVQGDAAIVEKLQVSAILLLGGSQS